MKKIYLLITCCSFVLWAGGVYALPFQWSSAVGGNDHWYDVVLEKPATFLKWEDAKSAAEAKGGHLATLTSEAESNFVWSLLADLNFSSYWLGGYRNDPNVDPGNDPDAGTSKYWSWVTGEEWNYTNWEVGEPNNGVGGTQDYLHFWKSDGKWDDMENGRYMAGYVVESDVAPVPEPATMILFGTGLVGLVGYRKRKKTIK